MRTTSLAANNGENATEITSTSTSLVSTGLETSIRPRKTGKVLVWWTSNVSNDTAGDGIQVVMFATNLGVPAKGNPPNIGDRPAAGSCFISRSANDPGMCSGCINDSIPIGEVTAYYLAFRAIGGGTVSVSTSLGGLFSGQLTGITVLEVDSLGLD